MRPLMLALVCLTGCEARILPPGLSPFSPPGGTGNGAGGSGGEGGGTAVVVDPCDVPAVSVGSAPMRRLSHDEYRNSLSDLQPAWATTVSTQAATLTPDSESLGFRNGAVFLDV